MQGKISEKHSLNDANESGVEEPKELNETAKSEKPVYKKPQLRKYTQIDYVTAYGVD